jgi:hypothetical protein
MYTWASTAIAILATLSEILPLLGCTKVNGILHGLHMAVIHFHAKSECNVTVEQSITPP